MKKLSRTTILMLAACLFILAVNIVLGFVLTDQSKTAMRILIENRMLDVSNTAAALLDGDYLGRIQPDDKEKPEYREILRILTKYQENIDLAYIYCIRKVGVREFVFTIDPSEDPGEFGEPVASTEALYLASLGTASVDKTPYEDRWGRFYSAYSPVYDSRGEITGIVAVDFSASWYEDQISTHVRTTIAITAASIVFAALIIFMITSRFRRRFRRMLKEMNVVSDSIETLVREVTPDTDTSPVPQETGPGSSDEMTELGNRIRSMEDRLGERIAFVRSQAYRDGLTGLGNRTAYEEATRVLKEKMKDGTAEFTVALFDLNSLKEINDRLGHEQGDRSIVRLAGALAETFPEGKTYRIGGDEFVTLLEGACEDMEARMDRLEGIIGSCENVSVAKGYSAFRPGEDTRFREVFRRADRAMYSDKKAYYTTHQDRRKGLPDAESPAE